MRILITGANGFIGSNLARYLVSLKKYKVFALVREKSNLNTLVPLQGKIAIVKIVSTLDSINRALCMSRPDVVVHLAAFTCVDHRAEEIKSLIAGNILFPTILLEAMVKNRVKFLVNTGSFWEHAENEYQYSPFNLYAATKSAFEIFLKYYTDKKDIRCLTLKLYGTYGPNDPRPKIFSLFKKSIVSKEPVLFSPGEQKLDLIYIDDVVCAYEKAIRYVYKRQSLSFESFFIGSGKGVRLRNIAKSYAKCAGSALKIKWGGLPYRDREIMDSRADIMPAKIKLNWRPRYDLKSGISKMLKVEGKL
jgi:nucleoside-diphosphate-sugar epimerase